MKALRIHRGKILDDETTKNSFPVPLIGHEDRLKQPSKPPSCHPIFNFVFCKVAGNASPTRLPPH